MFWVGIGVGAGVILLIVLCAFISFARSIRW